MKTIYYYFYTDTQLGGVDAFFDEDFKPIHMLMHSEGKSNYNDSCLNQVLKNCGFEIKDLPKEKGPKANEFIFKELLIPSEDKHFVFTETRVFKFNAKDKEEAKELFWQENIRRASAEEPEIGWVCEETGEEGFIWPRS